MFEVRNILPLIKRNGHHLLEYGGEWLYEPELAFAAVHQDASTIHFIPHDIKYRHNIVLAALHKNAEIYQYLSDKEKDDDNIIQFVLKNAINMIRYMPERIKQDESITLDVFINNIELVKGFDISQEYAHKLISKNGNIIRKLNIGFHNNKSMIMSAMNTNKTAYFIASRRLREDSKIMLHTVRINPIMFKHFELFIDENRQIYTTKFPKTYENIAYLVSNVDDQEHDNIIMDLKQIVNVAVSTLGDNIKYIIDTQLMYDELKLLAVKNDGLMLRYFYDDFDENLLTCAINQNPLAIEYASDELKDNEFYARLALEKGYSGVYKLLGANMKSSFDIYMLALQHDNCIFEWAYPNLQNDEYIVMQSVMKNGLALNFVPDEFKYELAIVRIAIAQNPNAIKFSKVDDEEIMITVINHDYKLFKYASNEARDNYRVAELVISKSNGLFMQYVSERLRDVRKLCRLAGSGNVYNFIHHVSKRLQIAGQAYIMRPNNIIDIISEYNSFVNALPIELHTMITNYLE